jgi:hypothetical protein
MGVWDDGFDNELGGGFLSFILIAQSQERRRVGELGRGSAWTKTMITAQNGTYVATLTLL